jgi:hypothetical protein
LHNIYRCLILPYITYGLIVWGHASKRYVNKILILQKRALRLIYLKKYKEHAIPLFIESKILPINMLYIKTVCNLMHDVSNESCSSSIPDCFIHSRQIHDHNTRHCVSKNYYIKNIQDLQKQIHHSQELEQKYGIIFPLMCVKWSSIENNSKILMI